MVCNFYDHKRSSFKYFLVKGNFMESKMWSPIILQWIHWRPDQLKGETSFPQGFHVREEKVPSGSSPFCQVSLRTENLFTKCSEFIFQEFKTYFIGSSGHWKILYSFPSDLARYSGTHQELTHLANHLDFPDTQKEVSKPRNIWVVSCVHCAQVQAVWKQPLTFKDGQMGRRTSGGSEKRQMLKWEKKMRYDQSLIKWKTYLSEFILDFTNVHFQRVIPCD